MTQQIDHMMIDQAIRELEQPSGKDDAGNRAREALKRRAATAKRTVFNLYLILTTFITVFVMGVAVFAYTEFQKPSKRVTDIRPCYYIDEKTGTEITGTREYSYPSKTIFGIDYRMSSQIDVKTKMDIRGSAMNITGITNDGWWSVYADTGEQGIQILKPASLYVIAMGKNTHVFPDTAFCH